MDALLAETFAGNADTEDDDGDERESGLVLDGTPEGDDDDADQGLADGDGDDSLEADPPQDADASDDSTEDSDDDGDDDPRITQAMADAAEARRQSAAMARYIEEQQIAAQEAEGEARYREFMESLEDMSPEDAANAKLEKIAEFAANLQRQQIQAVQQQQIQHNRNTAFAFIAEGGRLVADGRGGFQPRANATAALTEHERELLSYVTGSPKEMREFADKLIARRQQQTAAARKALATKHRERAALAVSSGEQRGATPAGKEPQTEDEILEATYARAPHLWALPKAQQSTKRQRTG